MNNKYNNLSNNMLPPPTHGPALFSDDYCARFASNTSKSKTKRSDKRVCWIDAVRGFVMFIVVFQHIRAFGMNLNSEDGILSFVYLYFFLTTFFLISGFLSKRTLMIGSMIGLGTNLWSRFKSLIIPTVMFWLVYNLVAIQNASMDMWGFPGGYWFTYTLFLISLATGIIVYICNNVHLSLKHILLVLLTMGIALNLLRILCPSAIDSGFLLQLRVRQFTTFFLYFVLGLLVAANKDHFYRYIKNQYVRTTLIGGTILLFIMRYSFASNVSGAIIAGLDFIIGIVSTLSVFTVFYLTKTFWDSENIVAKSLNLVGKRSLDVYMLHYFFIPAMPTIGEYFKSANNSIIELGTVGVITVIVVVFCLLTSRVIRLAPPIGNILFGK